MRREILTYPLERIQMKEELLFFADYMRGCGYADCDVLFGYAWGIEYYETDRWDYERIPLDSLVDKVMQVEVSGLGKLGHDDVWVKIPGLEMEFRFCNDCDIHINYEFAGEMTEFFYQRWKSRGFSPAEWLKAPDGTSSERLRFN